MRTRLVLAVATAATVLVFGGQAYAGPSPWPAAADQLAMPVLAPTRTPGMELKAVVPQKIDCGPIQEQLLARYGGGPNGKRLKVLEGKPQYCGDLGDAPLIARVRVHGKRASLYAYCEGLGCRSATYKYALFWRERGITIGLISRGTARPSLLAIAEGMQLVPDS